MWKRKFLRHFSIHFVISVLTLSVFAITRVLFMYADRVQTDYFRLMEDFGLVKFLALLIFSVSVFISLLSSLTELLLFRPLFHRSMPIGLRLLLDIFIRIILIVIVMFGARNFIIAFFAYLGSSIQLQGKEMFPVMILLTFAVALSSFTVEIDRKLGPGNLWKFLRAKFYRPREEQRLFVFIDLKDATRIAEQLGHLKFSHLIRDCFQDFSVVDNFEAEIYQYVGDEVVISWPFNKAFKNDNFLKAFYAFTTIIEKRAAYYKARYGLVPYFKGGAHCGPIVVTEVGDIKREISYHGDTINTASRIQGMCNALESQLLVSDSVFQKMKQSTFWNFLPVGTTALKGKELAVKLYKVEKPE